VLPGVSGSGKSSIARGGVAAKFAAGYRSEATVITLETSPNELLRDATRPPVLELTRRIKGELRDPPFATTKEQERWDACIDEREHANPEEVASLVVSLVRAPSGPKPRSLLLVMDQAEEWWDGDGNFLDRNRAMLVFLDHLTRSKAVCCLTVLQSEPTDHGQGGKLQSLRLIKEFPASTVEIATPLGPPGSTERIREIINGVVEEQVGSVPDALEGLVLSVGNLLEKNVPFLPLLALRLKRICEALRAQNLINASVQPGASIVDTDETTDNTDDDPLRDAATEKVHFAVAPWMTASILGELDALGESAMADIAQSAGDTSVFDAAFDLCMSKLIGVAKPSIAQQGAAEVPRSEHCVSQEVLPGDFGDAETAERLLFESLLRRRLVRYVGKKVRLTHISLVDHWGRAQQWFDATASRRNAMNRIAHIVEPTNSAAAIASNLQSPENWRALGDVLHHIARRSPLVPRQIIDRREALIDGIAKVFQALPTSAAQNEQLNLALEVGFEELAKKMLGLPGLMQVLDADASARSAEPLLIRLARAGLFDLVVQAAKQGCQRTAKSPQTGDNVFGILLHAGEHDQDIALKTLHTLLHGDPSDRVGRTPQPKPLKQNERAEILGMRTAQTHRSLLDHAAISGRAKAIRLVLSLAANKETRKALLDPHAAGATRTFESPLFLAVVSNKPAAAAALLSEAKSLLGDRALRKYVNSVPVASGALKRREPPIVAATRNGNAEMVKLLLVHGADPTKAGSDLCDAFQAALLNDDTKVLQTLLATNFRPGSNNLGFALAHWAAVLNAKASLLMLSRLEQKAPMDSLGRTPLHIACGRSQTDIVRALLHSLPKNQRGRQLAAFDNRGRNALTTALCSRRLDVAELLLEFKAVSGSVNAPDPEGYRPLHYAVRFCGLKGVSLLRSKGAQTDFPLDGGAQITPLQVAAMINDADACELLMSEASLAQLNPHKRTAVHYAARYGSLQALEKLLAHSSAPLRATNAEGQTALHLAAFNGHDACVALLLSKDSTKKFVDAVDEQKGKKRVGRRTALWSASSAGHAGVIKRLLAAGADIEHRAANHLRPIDEACRRGASAAVLPLLEAGARLDMGWLNFTPLHHAARGGHSACFHALGNWLQEREGPNGFARALAERTQFGDTPLQLLGKALVRATRPSALARPEEPDPETRPLGETEVADQSSAEIGLTAPSEEKPAGQSLGHAKLDLAGAAEIVKSSLSASTDVLDEETINDLAIGCAMLDDVEILRACRKAGVRFEAMHDRFGGTPLHVSAKSGALRVVAALIEGGADINASAGDGTRPLHNIVLHGSSEALGHALEIFSKAHGDLRPVVNASDAFGETALHKVAACKSPDLVEKLEILCAAGGDINRMNADGETPRGVLAFVRTTMSSTSEEDLKAEIELLDKHMAAKGGRVVDRAETEPRLPRVAFPIHAAIAAGQWVLMPKIKSFAPVACLSAPDPNGRTPLMTLASADWSNADRHRIGEWFNWLLSTAGERNAGDATGRTLAHYACLAIQRIGPEVVGTDAALQHLPRTVDLSVRDQLGRTPLHIAAAAGNYAALKWLLEQGQDAAATDELGNSPLHLAAQNGHTASFDILKGHLGQRQLQANAAGLTAPAIVERKASAFSIPKTRRSINPSRTVAARQRGRGARVAIWAIVATAIVAVGAVFAGMLDVETLLSLLPSR
jgi:ankyrin repeat protein